MPFRKLIYSLSLFDAGYAGITHSPLALRHSMAGQDSSAET